MNTAIPLVIAAHGSRDLEGVATCRALVERVAAALPGVPVHLGFVELAEPTIPEAVAAALAESPAEHDGVEAVVVPLMMGTGGHVQSDIPESVEEGRGDHQVVVAPPLSPDHRLELALAQRMTEALEAKGWLAKDTVGLVIGRGNLVTDANAEHYRLTRATGENVGLQTAWPGFIQVTRPSVPEALNVAVATGATQIVIGQNFLFPGLLRTWLSEQVDGWQQSHPEIEVCIAEVLGDCDLLAGVVVDRYREELGTLGEGEGSGMYLSALNLSGRDVLVVGAGHVAERRVARLLEAGAQVRVVAPNAGVKVSRLARQGKVVWEKRPFADADLDGAWYVQALSNDPVVNAAVAQGCADRHIFCVRGDKAIGGTAYTPATAQAGGVTVSVVGQRNPRRSAKLRDSLLRALQN